MIIGDKDLKLFSSTQAYALDQGAIRVGQLKDGELMARAGSAAYSLLRFRWPRARQVLIVCGPGNNGGDGYVLGSRLIDAGIRPKIVFLGQLEHQQGDALNAREAYQAQGGEIMAYAGGTLPRADVVVDAILGIGSDRVLAGDYLEAVEQVNRQSLPVLSLDLPTGIHADTGAILGETAVKADATITFIACKKGAVTGDALDYVGELYLDDLSVAPEVVDAQEADCRLMGRGTATALLPARRKGTHKGEQGRLLIVGGDNGMTGAVMLAGEAALRSGAGLVRAAILGDAGKTLAEIMVHRLENVRFLGELMRSSNVLLAGPGLGQTGFAREVFSYLVDHWQKDAGLVLDADALNCLAVEPVNVPGAILTPHPGEAAKLLDCSVADVQRDRYAAAKAIASRFDAVCVLKGAGTVISDGSQSFVCDRGDPAMATAGTGDVLAGMVAAMLGQGLAPLAAARLAVYLHGCAGEAAASANGNGTIASDLVHHASKLLADSARGL